MSRKEELLKIFGEIDGVNEIISPLINETLFLEGKLNELRSLPFIRVNPDNPKQQKATPASKMYKEFLQQYNNCIKILCSVLNKNGEYEESPLRAYLKNRM